MLKNDLKISLTPYIAYYLVCYILILIILGWLNKIGLDNFAIIEATLLSSFIVSFYFFIKHKRPMFYHEQSKITWITMILLIVISMLLFYVLLSLGDTVRKVAFAGRKLGLIMVFYGLWILLTNIFTMSFLKLSASIIEKKVNYPNKIIKVFIIISLTIFIADIIVNFLLNF